MHEGFVKRCQPQPALRPLRCRRHVPDLRRALDQCARAPYHGSPEARALGVQPTLELGGAWDEEPLEQLAAVQLERLIPPPACDGPVKGVGVALKTLEVQADFVIAAACEDGAEAAADHAQRLAQRGAGVLLIELRPEECEDRVAPVEAARGRHGEVGDEREPPRLRQQGGHLVTLGVRETHRSQRLERDCSSHAHRPRCSDPHSRHGGVTEPCWSCPILSRWNIGRGSRGSNRAAAARQSPSQEAYDESEHKARSADGPRSGIGV